ncbi:dynein axonemal assembly factor 8 isoform X1 [Erinaceus europaeus]|uniref:Dynein axonemal assembly factor 8 n=1 Tax=Erinaceus europaeus TaxID=9365 RepID=A0ABM3VVS5_ERIEU|nr:dynein axonemal assembly factor 8 isoform X1 [Erinaceus europaeus]
MASGDQDGGSSPGSPWAAILEAVREQLPSLDSDSSLSDCGEEELFIFQRNDTALIPDLSEELAEDPTEAWSALDNGFPLEPAEAAPEPWSERTARAEDLAPPGGEDTSRPLGSSAPKGTPRWQEGDLRSMSFNTGASQSAPCGPQGEASLSSGEGEQKTESPDAASPVCQASDPARRRALRRERRQMIEKDILHRVTWGAEEPARSDPGEAAASGRRPAAAAEEPQEGPLVLSLQQFEDRDLDLLLQSLRGLGDRPPGAAWWAADYRQLSDHAEPSTQDLLMEQLALLCASQSRASSSSSKVPDALTDTWPQKAGSSCASWQRGSVGTHSLRQRSWEAQPSTIFIDLRPKDPSPDRGLEDSSSRSPSSSSSEEEEEERAAPEGQESHSSWRPRDHTGKSQLLQQLRAFRQGAARAELPDREGPSGQRAQAPEDRAGSATQRKQHVAV